jgi:NAD(P)-dependent dehydrogenase (short-subunit alcohol dehydrogenase family)
MSERIAVVTGANTGIGLETARGLAKAGFRVVMTARDRDKGTAAVEDVRRSTGSDAVELLELDLASLESVRRASDELSSRHDHIDVLVNNAGLVLGDRRTTEDGFEATLGVNHLGHFLWTLRLLDRVKAAASNGGAPGRIVNLASDAHRSSKGLDFDDLMRERRPYEGFPAYCDSKLANILFTRELARRLEGEGVVVHAVHPGVVGTRFGRDGDVGGLLAAAIALAKPFLLSPEKGARTSLHVALSDDAARTTGDYWAKSKRSKPTRRARDDDAAARLWKVSEELVGLA